MTKVALLALLVAGGVLAQPVILQGPVADAITYSSARLNWVTDVDSDSVIRYGIDAFTVETSSDVKGKIHSWYMSGLAPNTTYRFQVCSRLKDSGEACKEGTVTTQAAENIPLLPAPPRQYVDTSMPSGGYGEPYIIDEQCSNLPATLQALRALEGDLNYEVRIAPGTTCAGLWTFPNRPNHSGWVVVTTTGTLPPPGTRVAPEDTPQMARLITDGLPGQMLSTSSFATTCTPKTLIWGRNAPGMGLFECVAGRSSSGGAKAVDWFNAGEQVMVTVAGHGYSTGDLVRVTDTKTGADGTWRITVIDENNFALEGARATKAYNGGGTVTRNDVWAQVPYRSGTEFPECNPNDWFLRTDTDPANGVYWCTSQNTWTHVRPGHYVSASTIAAIQFADRASRYRFIGIEVTHIPVPNPPPAEWSDGRQGNFGVLVVTNSTNDRIIFDRCDVHGHDYPGRVGRGFYLNGSNVAIIDSRVHKINRWTNDKGYATEASAVDIADGPGPGTLENNFLEAIGMTVFFPNPSRNILPAADYVIRRNYFSHPDTYLPGSPNNWSGKNYNNRQVLELKAGQRMLIEGNIFDGNWSDITQGAMVLLTPRTLDQVSSKKVASIEEGILKIPAAAAADPYTLGLLVSVRDTGTSLDGIWEIAEVLSPTTYRLANMPSGSAWTGTVVAVTSHMQITDIDIRNNIFRNGPNLLWITGHDAAPTTKTTQRIRLHNNLVVGMDVRPAHEGGRVSPIGTNKDGRSGVAVFVAGGMEDLIITKNTIFDFKGKAPSFMQMDVGRNAHSGLLVMDNIFTAERALISSINGGNQGKASLDLQWKQYPQPKWTFRNNVLCCNINVRTPDENLWPDSIAEIEFLNPLLGALQLNPWGRFSVAAFTGGTVGVDFDAIESAVGQSLQSLLPLITNQ
jgi:hypothetical protein